MIIVCIRACVCIINKREQATTKNLQLLSLFVHKRETKTTRLSEENTRSSFDQIRVCVYDSRACRLPSRMLAFAYLRLYFRDVLYLWLICAADFACLANKSFIPCVADIYAMIHTYRPRIYFDFRFWSFSIKSNDICIMRG